MKFKLGIRSIVISVFIILYASSMMILNNFFVEKQNETSKILQNLSIDEEIAKLKFKSSSDSLQAIEISSKVNQSLAGIKMIQNETKIYSSLILFLLMITSVICFIIVFYIIMKPLRELQLATEKIRKGDFNVYLMPKGMSEVKLLARSFNEMSRELESIQQKLLIAQKEMIWKDLARILTHEIKNPLTPIQLSMQRLEEKFETDPVKFNEIFRDSIAIIYQEIGNLQNLVQSFSSFAKDARPNPSVFDASNSLNEILRPYVNDYNIDFNLVENKKISFDQTHFYQIVTNIFQNAIESSGPQSKIKVSLYNSHSFVILSIKDEGSGIDPADLPRIFEPYFTRKSKGTGLGLALVKKLCDANHANVRVKSVLGKGTEFEIIMEEKIESIRH